MEIITQYRHQVIELIFPQNIVRTRVMTALACATIFPESFETTTVVTTIVKKPFVLSILSTSSPDIEFFARLIVVFLPFRKILAIIMSRIGLLFRN